MTARTLLLAVIVASAAGPAAAQRFYGEPDDFIQYGVGARPMAMGSAFSAVADDASASVYNPAGLSLLKSHQVEMMHAPLFEDTNLEYLGAAFPLTPSFAVGFSGVLLRTSGIEERDSNNLVLNSDRSIYQSAYMAGASARLEKFYLGATAKMITQNILGMKDSALGVDVGALYPATKYLRLSAVLQNLNQPKIQLIDDPDLYRPRVVLGAAVMIPGDRLKLTAEGRCSTLGHPSVAAGGEVTVTKNFQVRAGLDRQVNPTFGVGFGRLPLQFDYAFGRSSLGTLHRFTMGVRFGQLFRLRVAPEYEAGENAVALGASTNQVAFRSEKPRFRTEWWKMIIYDRDGNILREVSGMGAPPPVFWWDLRDTLGRPIKAGTYPYEFQVKYRGGDVWSEHGEVKATQEAQEQPVEMELKFPEQKQ